MRRFPLKSVLVLLATFVAFHFVIFFMGGTYRTLHWAPGPPPKFERLEIDPYFDIQSHGGSWLLWDGPTQYEPHYEFQRRAFLNFDFPFWNRRSGIGGPFLGTGLDTPLSPLGISYALTPSNWWDYVSLLWLFLGCIALADLLRLVRRDEKVLGWQAALAVALGHAGIFPGHAFVYGELFNQLLALFCTWGIAIYWERTLCSGLIVAALSAYSSFCSGMPQGMPGVMTVFGVGLCFLVMEKRLKIPSAVLLLTGTALATIPVLVPLATNLSQNYQAGRDYTAIVAKPFEFWRLFIPELFASSETYAPLQECSFLIGFWGMALTAAVMLGYRPRNWKQTMPLVFLAGYLLLSYIPGLAHLLFSHVPILKQSRIFRAFSCFAYVNTLLLVALSFTSQPPSARRRLATFITLTLILSACWLNYQNAQSFKDDLSLRAFILGAVATVVAFVMYSSRWAIAAMVAVEIFFLVPRHWLVKLVEARAEQPYKDYWETIDTDTNYLRVVTAGMREPIFFPETNLYFEKPNQLIWMKPIYNKKAVEYISCVDYHNPDGVRCFSKPKKAWLIGYVEKPCDQPAHPNASLISETGNTCLYKLNETDLPVRSLDRKRFSIQEYRWLGTSSLKVHLQTAEKTSVVFWEASDPNWRAYTGGNELTPVALHEELFPVFRLPKGDNHITLVYRPRWWTLLLLSGIAGWLLIIGTTIYEKRSLRF